MKRELGYFDYRFDLLTDNEASAKAFNDYWLQHAGCLHDLWTPCFRELTFSSALYNETMEATRNATKPVVLLYGLDDSWTGAAVKDQYINGTNVRKFILPAQNHLVAFSSDNDKEQCDAVRAILDGVLSTPQALDPVTAAPSPVTRKLLRNGQLIIMRDGHTYTVTGQQL